MGRQLDLTQPGNTYVSVGRRDPLGDESCSDIAVVFSMTPTFTGDSSPTCKSAGVFVMMRLAVASTAYGTVKRHKLLTDGSRSMKRNK